ncbi:MAG TPA: hypothetical protein VN915_07475 [Elusimicrobiota bacterium]|nr:hypothetical protein [Elusimicrobiota bacterium]
MKADAGRVGRTIAWIALALAVVALHRVVLDGLLRRAQYPWVPAACKSALALAALIPAPLLSVKRPRISAGCAFLGTAIVLAMSAQLYNVLLVPSAVLSLVSGLFFLGVRAS